MNKEQARSIYIPDDVWQRIREIAYRKDMRYSSVIVSLLRDVLGMDKPEGGRE